jgi:hypothetical protein
MICILQEHVREKRNALTVLDKKYEKEKPLEKVDEDVRLLFNLFLKKPGMREWTGFICLRISQKAECFLANFSNRTTPWSRTLFSKTVLQENFGMLSCFSNLDTVAGIPSL